MRRYDTTFILDPQIGDDRIDASIKTITSIISNGEGEVLRENRMGSRRLAYDIAKQSHGYYVCLIHESSPAVIKELDDHFTLSDDCMRHLTIIFDGDPHRKNMSEIMMGSDNERRDSSDGPSRDRRPAPSRSSAGKPADKAESSASTATATAPAPAEASKPAEKTESTATAEKTEKTETSEGETL